MSANEHLGPQFGDGPDFDREQALHELVTTLQKGDHRPPGHPFWNKLTDAASDASDRLPKRY